MNKFLLTLTLFLCVSAHCLASPPPVPVSKKASLEQVEADLKASKDEAKNIEKKAKNLKKELEDNREALIASSRAVQNHEASLLKLEEQMEMHADEYDSLQLSLSKDKSSIVQLILAMERMKSVPMEAMMIRPGGTLETAQSAMVMEEITAALSRRAKRLRQDVERLDVLAVTLKAQREELETTLVELEDEKAKLQSYVSLKEELYASSQDSLKAQQQEVKRISLQAKSMKDLIAELEKQRAREAEKRKKESFKERAVASLPQVFSGGAAQMPVAGVVKVGYGQPDHLDAPSDGLWIEGRGGALIVAPMDGDIRYVGAFKGYGNMVIIEHSGGYHSLIAGFDTTTTSVGHRVTKGEPLGSLIKKSNFGAPRLYYELRRHGKVVDPAQKLSGVR